MSYINKQTFEICSYNDCSNYDENAYFEEDENIALIIALLNKKGYVTAFCCSGHIFDGLSEVTIMPSEYNTIEEAPIEVLKDEEPKSHVYPQSNEFCYIAFSYYYIFDYLPKGFICSTDELNKTLIEKQYLSKVGTFERFSEIMETMVDLYKWVLFLDTELVC